MFPSKLLQRMRAVPPARRPIAEACVANAAFDHLVPAPLPEALEDNSDAAWQQWLAAHDTMEPGETVPMELRPEH